MTDRIRQTLPLALLTAASLTPAAAEAQSRGGASSYTCEGSAAYVANTAFTGDQRSGWSVNFRMSVNRATGSVMIYAVSGTTVIKPGRYTIAADRQGRMALSWNWIDQANKAQPVTMTIARSGEFEGAWSQTNPSAAAEALMGGIFGPEMGNMMRVTARGTFSGVCWQ